MDEWTKMSEMTNEELVVYAMGGCDRAIRLMMEKNEGLVVSKAKTSWEGIYATGMDKSLTQDDFIQLASSGKPSPSSSRSWETCSLPMQACALTTSSKA